MNKSYGHEPYYTASHISDSLESVNIPYSFISCILRGTAPDRHWRRVKTAYYAAEEYARSILLHWQQKQIELPNQYPLHREKMTRILLYMETIGHGGPGGMGGKERSTIRAEWAQELGKGRAQARDGAAWTAAIKTAVYRPSETWFFDKELEIHPYDLLVIVEFAIDRHQEILLAEVKALVCHELYKLFLKKADKTAYQNLRLVAQRIAAHEESQEGQVSEEEVQQQ